MAEHLIERGKLTRRRLLASAGSFSVIGTAGCLRLSEEQNATSSERQTPTPVQTEAASSEERRTAPSGDDITLTESWEIELLWNVFTHSNQIAGDRASRDGGYVVFADEDGNVKYTSDDIGGDYALMLYQGDALASNGATVFAAGRDVSSGGNTARLAAFDSGTGTRQWTHETEPTGTESRIPSLVADEETVYYAAVGEGSVREQRAVVRAVNAENNTIEWEYVIGESFVRGLVKYDSRIFVGLADELRLIDAATGAVENQVNLETTAFQGMARTEERLFIVDSQIRAYELKTGKELLRLWRDREPDSPIKISENVLYAGTDAGYVTAHDLEDGSKLWETRTAQSIVTKPAASDGTVFVGDSTGNISAIDQASGKVVYEDQQFTERPERTTVAAVGSVVCFSGLTTDNQITRGFEIG